MAKDGALQEAVKELYAVTGRLEAMYPGRRFTPDGHMVGSLGEVVAAEMHGLELFEASHPIHDAVAPDGKLVHFSTLKNCGSSSRLSLRIHLPTRVMRGSSAILKTGPDFSLSSCSSASFASASTHMLRNLFISNSRPPFVTG